VKRTGSPTHRRERAQRTFPLANEAKVPSTQNTAKIAKATRPPAEKRVERRSDLLATQEDGQDERGRGHAQEIPGQRMVPA